MFKSLLITIFFALVVLVFPSQVSAATFSASSSSCTVPSGGTSCTVKFTWDASDNVGSSIYITRNTTEVVLNPTTTLVNSSGTDFTASGSENSFELWNQNTGLRIGGPVTINVQPSTTTPTSNPAPTVQTTLGCNQVCGGSLGQCQSGLTCMDITGTPRCRLAGYSHKDNCQADGVSTTASTTSTTTSQVLGTATSAVKKATPKPTVTPTPSATAEATMAAVLGTQEVAPTPTPTAEDQEDSGFSLGILDPAIQFAKDHPWETAGAAGGISLGGLSYVFIRIFLRS